MRALPGGGTVYSPGLTDGFLVVKHGGWVEKQGKSWIPEGNSLCLHGNECEVSRIGAISESCKNVSTCFRLEAGFSHTVMTESAGKCTVLELQSYFGKVTNMSQLT